MEIIKAGKNYKLLLIVEDSKRKFYFEKRNRKKEITRKRYCELFEKLSPGTYEIRK